MQYMIIEKFKSGKVKEIYRRVEEKGRMLPFGVSFINSWINSEVSVCWQIMESETPEKINEWIKCWDDLVDFEVIPVIGSAEAKQKIFAT